MIKTRKTTVNKMQRNPHILLSNRSFLTFILSIFVMADVDPALDAPESKKFPYGSEGFLAVNDAFKKMRK